MSTARTLQLSGLAAILAGSLAVVFNLGVYLGIFPASIEPARQMLGFTLTIFAFIGLYAVQHAAAGVVGFIGFIVSLISLILNFATRYLFVFVAPVLFAQYPEAAVAVGNSGPYNTVASLTLLLAVVGYVLFGIGTLRANILPRGAAWLLIVGIVISYLFMMLPLNVGGILANLGFLWFGLALALPSRVTVGQPQAAL